MISAAYIEQNSAAKKKDYPGTQENTHIATFADGNVFIKLDKRFTDDNKIVFTHNCVPYCVYRTTVFLREIE